MYIHREIEKSLQPFLKRKEIVSIVGPRQSGKTTLLTQLLYQLMKQGKKKVKYITFEKRSEVRLFESVEDFKEIHKDYQTIIIDEFQYAKDGGQKLKYLYDTTKTKYIISGSSSLELRYKTGRYLVGRMVKFTLWPFSFREFLEAKNKAIFSLLQDKMPDMFSFSPRKSLGQEIQERLRSLFEEYLIFGAYPSVVLAKSSFEKQKLLEGILENYLLKDIQGLLNLTTEEELLRLAKLLAAQTANLINYQELSTSSGLNYKQLIKHLEILKQTYIVDLLRPYFTNKRTELTKNPKLYFIDSGFKNYLVADFRNGEQRNDIGSLVENYVYSSLKRNAQFGSINFWRSKSGAEVDFILQNQGEIIPIEVKYSSKVGLGKSVYSFIDKFSPPTFFILTKSETKAIKVKKTNVVFIPVYYL